MRTSIGLRLTVLVVGLLGASCMTKGQTSTLVITSVVGLTYTAPVAPATVGLTENMVRAGVNYKF